MKKYTINKRKIRKDCWDLDQAFLKWLQARLPVYLKDARKIVDFTWRKFEYKDKEYQQDEIVERMIFLLNRIQNELDFGNKQYAPDVDELLDLWKLVFYAMWW